MARCVVGLLVQQPILTCLYTNIKPPSMNLPSYPDNPATFLAQQILPQQEGESATYRQWPWRGLAFASDLGTVGYLVNQPKLGLLGWVLALPYYVYALWRQPDSQSRKEEGLYQLTANGIFPFMAVKGGTMLGELIYRKLSDSIVKKYPNSVLNKLTCPMYKIIGGLAALLIMTPIVGDPISKWIVNQYKWYCQEHLR